MCDDEIFLYVSIVNNIGADGIVVEIHLEINVPSINSIDLYNFIKRCGLF